MFRSTNGKKLTKYWIEQRKSIVLNVFVGNQTLIYVGYACAAYVILGVIYSENVYIIFYNGNKKWYNKRASK